MFESACKGLEGRKISVSWSVVNVFVSTSLISSIVVMVVEWADEENLQLADEDDDDERPIRWTDGQKIETSFLVGAAANLSNKQFRVGFSSPPAAARQKSRLQ